MNVAMMKWKKKRVDRKGGKNYIYYYYHTIYYLKQKGRDVGEDGEVE